MKLLLRFFYLSCTLAVLPAVRSEPILYDFESDLGSFVSNRDIWEWTDRESFDWLLPEGGDGFAVLYSTGTGDELYVPEVDIQNGLEYEISFFIASEFTASTTLQIQQLSLDGNVIEIIEDFSVLSAPTNSEWMLRTGSFPASDVPSNVSCI